MYPGESRREQRGRGNVAWTQDRTVELGLDLGRKVQCKCQDVGVPLVRAET